MSGDMIFTMIALLALWTHACYLSYKIERLRDKLWCLEDDLGRFDGSFDGDGR